MRAQGELAEGGRRLRHLLDRFDDKYVISLAARQDRRRRVVSQFDNLGIDLAEAGIEWFDALSFSEAAGFPNPGVRGCFNSHLTLLKRCVANGRPMIIMEDDIHIDPVACAGWDGDVAQLQDWDLCYFGYLTPAGLDTPGPFAGFTGSTIGGHFYAIKPDFAREMVDFMEACMTRDPGDPSGGPMYRDGAFNHYRALHGGARTVLAVPSLAGQFASRSDLASEPKLYDRLAIARPISEFLRKLRSDTFALRR